MTSVVVLLIERDDGVGTEGLQLLQGFWIAPGGNDAARAKTFRDLHSELAGDSGCAENQHTLAGDKFGATGKGDPGRHAGIRNPRGCYVIQAVG